MRGNRSGMSLLIACLVMGCLGRPATAQAPTAFDPVRVSSAQNATIGLIADGAGSTDTRIAADIARALDDSDKLRILPMLGRGSVQNIADLIYLKGVDIAIVDTDVLTQTMQAGTIPREGTVQYIAKLFPEEVHILARKEISSLNDLTGKPVAVGAIGSGTEVTATNLLDMCHIIPNLIHEDQTAALDHLRHGEIVAMFVVGGMPVPVLQGVEAGSQLHFVPIPLNAQLVDSYLPTSLDHQSYPDLVPPGPPVDTVAVGAVLVTLSTASDSARAKRVNRFVDALFDRFEQFRRPGFHPKWREVNLSAQVQGWVRYPEALGLLHGPVDPALRTSFDAYLNQSGQTTAGMDIERRESLFHDFLHWREQHSGP
jgi:TRAP transporter TAXI family solute receptor